MICRHRWGKHLWRKICWYDNLTWLCRKGWGKAEQDPVVLFLLQFGIQSYFQISPTNFKQACVKLISCCFWCVHVYAFRFKPGKISFAWIGFLSNIALSFAFWWPDALPRYGITGKSMCYCLEGAFFSLATGIQFQHWKCLAIMWEVTMHIIILLSFCRWEFQTFPCWPRSSINGKCRSEHKWFTVLSDIWIPTTFGRVIILTVQSLSY